MPHTFEPGVYEFYSSALPPPFGSETKVHATEAEFKLQAVLEAKRLSKAGLQVPMY